MKKNLIALMCFLLVTVAFASDTMIVQCDGISIEAPVGWLVQYTQSPTVFMMYSPLENNDTFQENGNIVVEDLPTPYTIPEYMDLSIEFLQSVYTDYKLLEREGNRLVITGHVGDILVQQVQFYHIVDNTAYVLTFTSNPLNFKRYTAVFNSIAQSVKFQS